jgi:adenylosuccinate lyase
LQLVEAGGLLDAGLERLRVSVGEQAVRYKDTPTIGRTHGVHAEPTTFGLKLAIWYDELGRQRRRLDLARADVAVGKISGAVGTHAHVPADLEEEVCSALSLQVAPASNQIVQRDRHAFFLSVLAGIGGTLEKIAVEVRHLQRTEVREVEEPFLVGNQGSSAMPHKRNPHASERICGLARLLRGYALTAAENVALWHERDISHSSAERVVFPDACIVLDYMLAEVHDLIAGMVVYPDRMRANLDLSGGAIYSQRAMLALVEAGLDRQEAYSLVQRLAQAAWDGGTPFRDALAADARVSGLLTAAEIENIFDPLTQLSQIDTVFARLGLIERAGPRLPEAVVA